LGAGPCGRLAVSAPAAVFVAASTSLDLLLSTSLDLLLSTSLNLLPLKPRHHTSLLLSEKLPRLTVLVGDQPVVAQNRPTPTPVVAHSPLVC